MAEQDRRKWDRKFSEMPDLLAPRPPGELVVSWCGEGRGKRALDLACGGGRHTRYLSERGYRVDAVDISAVALDRLRPEVDHDRVRLIEADLDAFTPQSACYDLIVMTNYLDRALIARAQEGLKADGIFIVETYMNDPENEKKDSNPDYLLAPCELKSLFSEGFSILEYREFWNETYEKYRMKKQAIAARKTTTKESV